MNTLKTSLITQNFKRIIYFFIHRFTRTRIHWFLETLKFFQKNKNLVPRNGNEFLVAEGFRTYFESLGTEGQLEARNKLVQNLDMLSIESVDNFIKRQLYIANHNILEQGKLFTQLEIEQQKECSEVIHEITNKMSPYHFSFLPSECFYGMSGLRWLPIGITNKIKNGVFIDVGAYEGDTAVFLAMNFNPSQVYAFEPEAKNFQILSKNARILGHNIIIPINSGLSDHEGTTHITSNEGESHLSTDKKDQEIKLTAFDYFWPKQNNQDKITLIKMDIEGAEMQALRGLEKTIIKDKPVLAISIYHNASDFFTIKPWLENICPDYKYIIRKASPFALTGETMLVAYID